jgi:hypothetical protein
MRRSIVVLVLVLTACLMPTPAHAYFWDWVDGLSGPKFHGATVEWKVWCKTDTAEAMLSSFRVDLARLQSAFSERAKFQTTVSSATFDRSIEALKAADKLAKAALDAVTGSEGNDPSLLLIEALRFRKIAKERFVLAEKLTALGAVEVSALSVEAQSWKSCGEAKIPDEPKVERSQFHRQAFSPGIAVSLCGAKPLERHSRYVNLNFAWAYDKLKENRDDGNSMVTIGASYNSVVTPWLTVGLGAGVATFSSRNAQTFHKFYVEPYIVDIRPFAAKQSRYSQNPWPQVLFFRYSTILFPTGFEQFRFGNRSPQYPAELVHTYGVHADLEPLIRKLRNRY